MRFLRFSLRLTRWGAVYLAAAVMVGGAAVNTGNNPLMMLFALLLGAYVVAGTWSRQVLGRCRVAVRWPREAFAGRPAEVEVTLENRSRLFPAYGLVLRDAGGRAVLVEPYLPARGRARHAVELTFQRRGWHTVGPWRLEVLLPLGFFVKSVEAVPATRLLVYPRILAGPTSPRERERGRPREGGWRRGGREGQVLQLRPWREGDERRQIHWKQTARQRRLIVTERQAPRPEPVLLHLDPRLPRGPDAEARFERAVSAAATEALRRLAEGRPVGLRLGRRVVGPVSALRQRAALLRPLAELRPLPADASAGGEATR